MSLEPAVTHESNVTPVTRNGAPLSNAERQRLYRERQKRKNAQPATPKRTRPGGHKPGGSERHQEAKRQAEAELANRPPEPKVMKPPVRYSEEIADTILQRLRDGESLLSICKSDDLPSESAVRQWAADPAHPFAANYMRAREVGYLKMADEVIALSDGLESGDSRFEPGVVQRHRLQVDSRKWLLGKALPKVFGDRVDVTSAGQQIAHVSLPDIELARRAMHWLTSLKSEDVIDAEVVVIEHKSEGER